MKFFNWICLFLGLMFFSNIQAQTFDFNQQCQQAYQAIFKLKLDEGLAILEKEKENNPSNYMPYFIENYADILKLFINDNQALYDAIEPKVEARLAKLKSANSNSPYYLYTQADIHLQWAFCKTKFGNTLSAVFEVKKAHGLLLENQKKYPDFKPNIKSLGLLHTLFGAIPDKYKFAAKMLGFKGSIDEGLQEIHSVLKDEHFQFKEETVIMYTLLILHLKKDEKNAWNMINQSDIPLGDNLLNHFIAATVAAHTGKNDNVISILSNRPNSKEYYPFPYLDFMMGCAKLNNLSNNADVYFKKFLAQNRGRSYQKEAYRKLAWFYLIHGNADAYNKYMSAVLKIKSAPTDEDKSAQKEATSNLIPNKILLTARVLSDGAYYNTALKYLNNLDAETLKQARDKIEYYYRKASILDALNQTDDAIKNYLVAIQKGSNYDYYFAANASLKLASVYEKQKQYGNAIFYFKKAIDLDKDEYADSIDAEAKAGLNRLKKYN